MTKTAEYPWSFYFVGACPAKQDSLLLFQEKEKYNEKTEGDDSGSSGDFPLGKRLSKH